MAARQIAEAKVSDSNADESLHVVVDRFEHAALAWHEPSAGNRPFELGH